MKSRSEAKAEAKKVKNATSKKPEVPDDPFNFPTANRGGKRELRPDLDKIVMTNFVVDLHETWVRLSQALTIGEKRSDRGTLQRGLDEAESNASLAHRLFVTAKVERDRWEKENEKVVSAMWSAATKSLQSEKVDGLRAKQITDADVRARIITMHPDEYQEIEMRKAHIKATVESLQDLAEQWKSRCNTLRVMKSTLRG